MSESYIPEQKEASTGGATLSEVGRLRRRVKDITRVISFTSGKGGVGKTHTVVNLAIALSRQGSKVLILDADLGLANVDILLGLNPKYTLQDVFAGTKSLEEIVVEGPEGISIIPAASGVESICDLSLEDRMLLLAEIENSALSFDYLLIDTRAGISSDVMYFNSASSEIVIVINPEPTSLTDAYAMVKVLCSQYGEKRFSVISNNVKNAAEGAQTFEQLQRVVNRFLQVQLKYLGYVPNDSLVSAAVKSQRGLLEIYPTSPAGLALSALARKIDEDFQYQVVKGGMQFFFRHLLEQSVVRS